MAEEGQDKINRQLPPPPQVLALNVCDAVYTDPWTLKRTLIGLFTVIQAVEFPAFHPLMAIHGSLTNGHGRVKLQSRLVDIDEERQPIFTIDHPPLDFSDPRMVFDFTMQAGGIVFPIPGEYRVQLLANGELICERRILLLDARKAP